MNKSKKEKCLKKSNILIYQQPTGERVTRQSIQQTPKKGIEIPVCQPKHIRICTGADLRKMCAPSTCPGDVKKKSFKLIRLLGFGVKSAIAAGIIYVTYDMGIWGTTDDTQELYATACSLVKGSQPKQSNKWDPPSCKAQSQLFSRQTYNPYGQSDVSPISIQATALKLQDCWDSAVHYTFVSMANFPYNLIEKMKSFTPTDDKEPETKCVPYSQLKPADQEELIYNQYKRK